MLKITFKIVGFFGIAYLGGYLYSQNHYHYHYYRHNDHYHYYLHQNQNYHQNHNHGQEQKHNHGQIPKANHRQSGFESLAETFESQERAKWQQPDKVIQLLGDISNKTVADLGAGTGYFSFRLVKVAKKVIALDTSNYFIQYIQNKRNTLSEIHQDRLLARWITNYDPGLQKNEADIVLTVNVYHHISDRIDYFKKLLSILPEGGELVVIDFKKNSNLPGGPPEQSRLSVKQVINELSQSGFKSIQASNSILEHQYVVIAKK